MEKDLCYICFDDFVERGIKPHCISLSAFIWFSGSFGGVL